jgi:DNA-binding response OmpR family regulator
MISCGNGSTTEIRNSVVVEDDQKVARFIQKGLEEEGMAVDVLTTAMTPGCRRRWSTMTASSST